jgi:hypothetical protein
MAARGPRVLGEDRQSDRSSQPDLLHLRRAHRFQRVDVVEHRGRPDDRRCSWAPCRVRLGAQRQSSLVPGCRSQRCRRVPAVAVHICRPDFRRPQLDDHFGVAAGDPVPAAGLGGEPPPHPVSAAGGYRRDRRFRRRQLCLVDGQHLVLLPGEGEGLGAWPQRSWRQHRGSGRAEDHSADRDSRWRSGAVARRIVLCAIGSGCRGVRIPVHEQPHRSQGRREAGFAVPAASRYLDHVAALHRHLRVLHRLLGGVPDPAQDRFRAR